jgi:hypothetical protein
MDVESEIAENNFMMILQINGKVLRIELTMLKFSNEKHREYAAVVSPKARNAHPQHLVLQEVVLYSLLNIS